jgi:hypothetical protein
VAYYLISLEQEEGKGMRQEACELVLFLVTESEE